MTHLKHIFFALFMSFFAAFQPLHAQLSVDVTADVSADLVIAVPAFATPQSSNTAAGTTDALGRQIAEVITTALRNSGLFRPLGPGAVRAVSFPEVTAPDFSYWPGTGAAA